MPGKLKILGEGVYTPKQVARLVGGSSQEVLRWTRGSGATAPLWNAYYQPIEDSTELSFADLIEVRVVKHLRSAGISLQSIRFAIHFAKEKYGLDRPLSYKEFRTDGAEILMEAVEEDGEFVSLSKKQAGQKVFRDIVSGSLVDLEYEDERVARWRPRKHRMIVIDPQRVFGDPILDEYGISTATLAKENELLKDSGYLAKIYDIPKPAVAAALKFEVMLEQNQRPN